MSETFGARLRQHREEQNIALSTIAEQTKIKLSLLEGLERDDVSHWPSGIFRRAYIRDYARAIGLSPVATVREFLERYPDPDEVAEAAVLAAAAERQQSGGGPPSRLRFLVDSAIGSLSRFRRNPASAELERPGAAPVNDTESIEPADHVVVGTRGTATDHSSPAETPPSLADDVDEVDAVIALDVLRAREEPEPGLDPDPTEHLAGHSGDAEPLGDSRAERAATSEPDLMAFADLCTLLGQADTADAMRPLLDEAARILGATGLIVWMWDKVAEELRPTLAHGYPDSVLARLPAVKRDAENATAAAFRLIETCAIRGDEHATSALVVPLLTPGGCAGVLALELAHGAEQKDSVRAVATILAAFLAQLTCAASPAEEPDEEIVMPPMGDTMPIRVSVPSKGYERVLVRPSSGNIVRATGDRHRHSLEDLAVGTSGKNR